MSYNKLKSLVANVEAIETAMKIQVQGRQATAEEKEILSRYSGFGGIKEVLNIGTDKPIGGDMQEPIQRLQELINAYPHFTEPMRHNVIEGIKASVLTAFYTPKFLVDAVVRQIHATFSENGLKMRSFLEPSAGIGGFLPIAMSGTYDYAIEKDLISGMILSLLHENTLTRTTGFEAIGEQGFEHTTFDVIASNIPFGNFRVFDAELWKKGGMYEQATKTIHNYFFVKAMELLNEGGLLAFITSRGIADTPGNKFVREYLVNHADLISAIRLPDMLFMQTSGIEVGSDLLIFQKHTRKAALSQREQLFLQVGREKADATGTMTEYANKLVVIKDEKNIESGLQPLEGLIDKGTTALSLYGIANSFEQLSQKPIVIGEKYIQINRQGTLVRNPNRVYTTKGEVAKGVGRKIYIAGLVIDTALWISGKQTFSEAALNMGVNTGIYIIGSYFPPVGIALGILWFITSVSKRPYISPPSYEEIHGTITPADATRVDRPYYCEPMRVRPNHKKHILRQGK